MQKSLLSLLKKDLRMMISGKFFLLALGSLLLYTLFINFGYVNFMKQPGYGIYMYVPPEESFPKQISEKIVVVQSEQEIYECLSKDTNGVGIIYRKETPKYIMYYGSDTLDNHRIAYTQSILEGKEFESPIIVGNNTAEAKQRKEMSCELLFIEIVAVGFLGIASILFKEKQMGVMRVYGIMPVTKALFIISKLMVFLASDLVFAALLTLLNIKFPDAANILPRVLLQTGILSLIMALVGMGCSLRLRDFKLFSLVYLVIALFVSAPVFLSANTSVQNSWIIWHPFYHLYMEMKNAFFNFQSEGNVYFLLCFGSILLLFLLVRAAFVQEFSKEG
ncbi:MAG: ABC transporter permease [Lachnospiraceae bacterium]|nr:ABC transporter permease [Lachnospiraceae bacterium]